MSDLSADLKQGVRSLLARPTFALAATLTLGLGVGMTTAIFSVVNAVVLRPLAFPNADRLVTICEEYPGSTPDWCSISPPNVHDIASRARSLDAIGIGRTWSYHLKTPDGQPEINAAIVTPGALTALGARAVMGRLLEPGDLIGRPSTVAMVSYESWQTRFGADPNIVGRTLMLDTLPVTIVGVMAPNFVLPKYPVVELWRPIHLMPTDSGARAWRGFVAYGRLREGVTLDQARREIAGIAEDLRRSYFSTTERWAIVPRSLQDLVVGSVRPKLFAVLGAAALILLIACVNVANLFLVRASARSREIAVRAALGATRARLARTILSECILVGVAGGALGLLLAFFFTSALKALAPSGIPRIDAVNMDLSVLTFALSVGIGAAIAFGLLPALRAGRADLARVLHDGGRSASRQGGGLRAVLVVVELALAVMLVAGAGLLIRTFAAYVAWNPGFEREHLLMFTVSAPEGAYPSRERIAGLWTRIEDELAALPGVQSVATASAGPLFGGDGTAAITLTGSDTPLGANVAWFDVSPGWFHTLGVPIVRGRDLKRTDIPGTSRVTLVNETFAARYWPGQDVLGKRFTMDDRGMPLEIVGVVGDVPGLKPGSRPDAEVYWSNRQLTRPFTYVLVRTSVPPTTLVDVVRSRLTSIDRDLEPRGVRTYSDLVGMSLRQPRFEMLLLATFGLSALLLGAVGIYGLLAYVVSMRSREIAIRLALGAQPSQVLGTLIGWGVRLTLIGGVVGIVAALALGRTVATMVAGVSTHDPVTFVASALVLVLVALAACFVPARRASLVDPAATLSAE